MKQCNFDCIERRKNYLKKMSQCYHLIIIYPKAINKSPQAVSFCEYGITDLVIPLNHCAL